MRKYMGLASVWKTTFQQTKNKAAQAIDLVYNTLFTWSRRAKIYADLKQFPRPQGDPTKLRQFYLHNIHIFKL